MLAHALLSNLKRLSNGFYVPQLVVPLPRHRSLHQVVSNADACPPTRPCDLNSPTEEHFVYVFCVVVVGCASWCATHSQKVWATKCTWISCGSCPECPLKHTRGIGLQCSNYGSVEFNLTRAHVLRYGSLARQRNSRVCGGGIWVHQTRLFASQQSISLSVC